MISERKSSLKRTTSLVRVRKIQLDSAAQELAQIVSLKNNALVKLRENQKKYMDHATQINKFREQGEFDRSEILEPALRHQKDLWQKILEDIRKLEITENEQKALVQSLQIKHKQSEKLLEEETRRYNEEFNRLTQQHQDEMQLQKINRDKK